MVERARASSAVTVVAFRRMNGTHGACSALGRRNTVRRSLALAGWLEARQKAPANGLQGQRAERAQHWTSLTLGPSNVKLAPKSPFTSSLLPSSCPLNTVARHRRLLARATKSRKFSVEVRKLPALRLLICAPLSNFFFSLCRSLLCVQADVKLALFAPSPKQSSPLDS